MERVLCFGDSITWGAVDKDGLGWVGFIKKDFGQDSENNPSVYNLGISGDTTDGLLKRFRIECEARLADGELGIVFAIGINDSRYINEEGNHEIPENKFVDNLEQLIEIAREFTDKIAFIGLMDLDDSKTTPIPWSPTKYYTNKNMRRYNSAIKSVCEKNSLPFVDMEGVIPIEMMPDGLHPNTEGHKLAAEKIQRELRGFFK
ncbi:MAG: GDSL-type esterase/lipase family protein [Candidatus Colwellbacteria bacterium]